MLACHEYKSSEFLNTTDCIRHMDLYCIRTIQPPETSQSRGIRNVKLEMEVSTQPERTSATSVL